MPQHAEGRYAACVRCEAKKHDRGEVCSRVHCDSVQYVGCGRDGTRGTLTPVSKARSDGSISTTRMQRHCAVRGISNGMARKVLEKEENADAPRNGKESETRKCG